MSKPLKNKERDIIQLIAGFWGIIIILIVSSYFFFRIDLTSEKRYTLSPVSKMVLKNLDEIVYVKVYLDGELNIPFRKMKKSILEMLEEFKVYAGDNLEYEFINPFKNINKNTQNDLANELYKKGLKPTNIIDNMEEGGSSEKIIFPGVIVYYKNIEVPINLLQNLPDKTAEENINNSIATLEYKLTDKIKSLTNKNNEKVAFIQGHGELKEYEVGDITRELSNYFQVDTGTILGKPGILDNYKAIFIAKPTTAFDERDKFVIDQYIMKGGIVLWFIDEVSVSLDSLTYGNTIAIINQLNIDDLLFKYGVRINPILVKDIQCNFIPVNVSLKDTEPKFVPSPWLYFPLLLPPASHPVTKNLNMIKTEFVNSIDTIEARTAIKKTVLLKTSKLSKEFKVPAIISLDEISQNPDKNEYNSAGFPVVVLLEGKFESAFKNRMIDSYFPQETPKLISSGIDNKMLIVSDGDMIKNDAKITSQGTYIYPLGFDKYTQQTFGNKEFMINVINYMTQDEGLINLRSREFKLRLLNREKIKDERLKWQIINIALPAILVILLGIIFNYIRIKKYTKVKKT